MNNLIAQTKLSCKALSVILNEDYLLVRRWRYGGTKIPKSMCKILKYIILSHDRAGYKSFARLE